jgi:phosphoglucosamine mutase
MDRRRVFGTDGIRGTANTYPITAEVAMKFGMAAGAFFKRSGHRNRVIIAKDTRLSGYMIEPALVAGFVSVGVDVTLVGPMPTPAVSMLIKSLRADIGVMISASHNPYYDNGLKLFNAHGLKLTDEEEYKIQELMELDDMDELLVPPQDLGRAKRLDDAAGRYIEHVKYSFAKDYSLEGIRVVLDCANGSAYKMAPTVLWELGAEVISMNDNPNGFNINDECGATFPEKMAEVVRKHKADIGFALDGDADRLIACDEHGQIMDGDNIIACIATHLKRHNKLTKNAVVVTHMSNGALDAYLQKQGIKTFRTQVGDRYVSQKMFEKGLVLGGEKSGHIIYSKYATTGDGLLAALQLLSVMVENGCKASELNNLFAPYPQVMENFRFDGDNPLESQEMFNRINNIQQANDDLRFLIRKSGTEPLIRVMVEGQCQTQIANVSKEIIDTLYQVSD